MDRPDLTLRRAELIAEIYEAFRNVRRGFGLAWDRSPDPTGEVVDWRDLIDDLTWDVNKGPTGGFQYLDAEGFRFYLAPAMIRGLRRGEAWALFYALVDWRYDSDRLSRW